MARIFQDFIGGKTDAALTAVSTTLSSPALAAMQAVASPDTMMIALNPDQVGTAAEIVTVTAHTAAATTATITRGSDGTTAIAHVSGIDWVHGAGAFDVSQVTIRKASDESVSNTTLQDDDDLKFSIAANEIWVAQYHLYVTNAASTADFKGLVTVPAGATARWGILAPDPATTTTTSDVKIQSHGSAALSAGVPTSAAADTYIQMTASVANSSTAGSVVLQWAQNSTDGANPTTVKAGSFMSARRVG